MDPISFQKNIKLAPFTSWLVGGEAEYFFLPNSLVEIQQALKVTQTQNLSVTVLGGGSNILISDEGISGLTLCLKNFSGIKSEKKNGRWHLEVLAGTSKSDLLKFFLKHKLAPAYFLAGIPGDVGGGIVMNAGIAEKFTPREFVELTDWIEVFRPDGKLQRLQKNELQWGYRHCQGWQPGIIVQIGLSWSDEPEDSILVQVKAANQTRLSKQPLDKPSCGSVFINPSGHKAAQLIEQCNLKGFSIGDAQVSNKHANFIVNLGQAKASQIWSVIQHVKKVVLEKTGVELTTEVVRLGKWAD